MKYALVILFVLTILSSFKPKPAYQIFSGEKAKRIDFDKMMKGLKDADVVFFGEIHNNSICHWLQLQVLKNLKESTDKNVIIGAEIFEADNQLILNEYLSGLIKEDHLKADAKIWDNYSTDYAPIVNFAKEKQFKVIATSVPRRYANIVARNGFEGLDQLDDEAKKYIAPLPFEIDYELAGYKEIASMMSGHMGRSKYGGKKMVDAQAVKDATMAHFILENWSTGHVFYHLNGSFHSKNKEGIVYFLKTQKSELNIVTITVVDQNNIDELEEENVGLADFVIAIPSDMIKTF